VKRLLLISLALVFSLLTVLSAREQKPRNQPPSIDSFTSSLTAIRVCPWHPELYDKPEVELVVKATDPDGDALRYDYFTRDGTISGKGSSVIWDLNNVLRGPHEVRVRVTDRRGGKAEAALTVMTVDGGSCDPPPPKCPTVKVSCPTELDKSKPFVFSLVMDGKGRYYQPPSFYWKLNAGRIVEGQYGRKIKATTTGAPGFEKITATVEVGGLDPSCFATASCSTKIIW
jgi:hypothetical protein